MRLLTISLLLVSAISCRHKPKLPEQTLACPEGLSNDADGNCVSINVTHDSCDGVFNIKRGRDGCIFYTQKQVSGCVVTGFAPYHNPLNDKCLIKTGYGRHCELHDFDQKTKTCNTTIELEKAGVHVYLERRESGFYPQVMFNKSDSVKAGAEFEFLAHEYPKEDIDASKTSKEGMRIVSVELIIPWRIRYTNGSGKELCAEGQITKDTSKDYPSEGMFCAGS